jgi:ribosomal protein S15P/S13E
VSEEQTKEIIEQVGYQEFYRYFQEKTTLIEQQRKEIERLNNELQDFKVQDISNQEQLYNLIEENERLNNIINELEKDNKTLIEALESNDTNMTSYQQEIFDKYYLKDKNNGN